jgi:hypothetical protein
MALKPFNSVAGFSVGEIPSANIILANGDITASNATFSGNLLISNANASWGVKTDNLYYSNGVPYDMGGSPAGSNNQIQYNIGGEFAASANFTFDPATNLLTVAGNIDVANADLGNLVVANFVNVASNIVTSNLTVNLALSGNTANFSGNIIAANGNLGNLAIANFVNVASNTITNNLTINLELAGNTANFSGNIKTLNANLGNLVTANYANLTNDLVVQGNISNANNINVTNTLNAVTGNFSGNITSLNANLGNLATANYVNVAQQVNGNVANFSGNLTASNANLGNLAEANFVNVSSNVNVTNTMQAGNVRTDNLLYANGVPWDMQEAAGSNNQIQFNINNNFAASANLTYNDTTQQFTVLGNSQFNNANLGNITTANFANIASNVTTSNLTVNLELAGNTANFSGNVIVPNLTVNLALSGNTANFSGNIVALNANLGNLAIANFVQTGTVLNGNSNIAITANSNVVITATSNAVVTISGVGANITGYVTANGEGTFGGVKSNTVTAQGGNLTIYAAAGNNYVELRPTGTGQVDVGNFRIESLQNPVNAQDAATKFYVDTVAEGLHIHASCGAATPDTLANVSSGTVTYNNGTAGVGATLVTTGTYTLIDGVNVASVGFRILVKDEANLAHNGIYTYANSTALIRATDFDTAAEIAGGDFTFVTGGTVYNSTGWVQIDEVNTVGTDPIEWDQFSGAGEYTAGQGLTLTGTVFSVNTDGITTEIAGGNVVVKANAQFTTPNIGAAIGTSLAVTGNIVGNNVAANSLTSSGNLSVTGNIVAANISANANLTVNNATVNLALSGNTANFSGNISALNANLGNLATANFFTGTLINGTSNIVVNNNGNIDLTSGGNTTLIVTATGANVNGYANVSGNLSAANIAANIANVTNVKVGNTQIGFGTATTTSISANQTISTLSVTGVTGIEFLVKGVDSSGSKYVVATVQAVTDGTSVDFTTFGTVSLGGLTGVFAVNIVGSNVALQVSPSSTNSTVWTTQFRTI